MMKFAEATLLLVDDEPRMLQSLRDLMIASGYKVVTALGGQEAVTRLNGSPIDLMLLDLKMPGFSGHQVMDYLDEKNIDTTVIVVSGETSFDSMSQVLRRRAYDYIKKPYAPDELLQTVENALEQRRLQQQNKEIYNKLQASERLHRYMVNSSPDIVYMLDEKGYFTFVNDRIVQLLGYEKDELIGKHHSEIVYFEDMEQARYVFNERRTDNRIPRNVELRLKCKDADRAPKHFETNTIPIELSATGIYGAGQGGNREFLGTYGVARDMTERKEAERTINFQAYHDLLTQLPNRALFKDRLNLALAQTKRSGQRLAVMFLDLDRFKLVNDTLGHICGDELLQAVSHRLQDCLREGDTLARFGGDEFTLLLPQIYGPEDAESIAKKIIHKIKDPFFIEGHELYVTISIGIAMYPHDGTSMDALVKNADIAMYCIKGRGSNEYQFFRDDMNEVSLRRLSLERGMRKALENNEFVLHYQPQVDAVTGKIVAMEALVRWEQPDQGLILPSEFIGIAEETGLILQIGEWVMRKACETLRSWHNAGVIDIRMAVNLSAIQVEHKSFVNFIMDVIKENSLVGDNLEVEITENLIMQDMDNTIKKLVQLSERGVKIAIDDFGTGYSSLSYLQRLPIHTLKVDRAFVHEINNREDETCIVNAIIAMAQGLNLNLIAEGVETEEQLAYLRNRGCAEMQGFLFSHPLPEPEARRLLLQRPFESSKLMNVG
ncbi:MAG: EAL domain-containing protein [Pseudomonadales bacterium]|nr:EAL domain-containing protein [Pseudomonadales bacterium]